MLIRIASSRHFIMEGNNIGFDRELSEIFIQMFAAG